MTDGAIASVRQVADAVRRGVTGMARTPLLDLPVLAERLGIAQVLAKDEGRRALGSFKSLGGTYAGLRALARAAGSDVAGILAGTAGALPGLVCASDGNHGLAVARAARLAKTEATVVLHNAVPRERAERIAKLGATIVWIAGTYDDAVAAAAMRADGGGDLLVADTTDDVHDPVVGDVITGYGLMASEIREQVTAGGHAAPSHLFVQAGVGGLAAALARDLGGWLAAPAVVAVVEPSAARCVGAALEAGRVVQIAGDLRTAAEMLACGRASAPAIEVLRACGAVSVGVDEPALRAAPAILRAARGPATTPSGAAGLAGALAVAGRGDLGLGPEARLLLVLSEGELEPDA